MSERIRSEVGMTDGVKISIIVPAYNVAPYLRECLDSVLAQDFENWECIAVDDESTDDGPRILDAYAAKDGRIRVIHQKNKGEGGARNSGIAAAKGEWLFFLDGDDKMARGALRHFNRLIERFPDERLIRFGLEQYQDGTEWDPPREDDVVVRKEIPSQIPMPDFFTYVWQHLYRRDIVDGILFKGYKRGCDRVFVDDVLLNRVDSFVETGAVLYGYRLRAGSAMNSVPTAPVLIDEMQHRRDLVVMIESGKKYVPYAGSWWLEGYFTDLVGQLIATKTSQERKMLWREWYYCVRDMHLAAGLSRRTRLIYRIACCVPSPIVWWLLARAYPWYRTYGILPRAWRKLERAFH